MKEGVFKFAVVLLVYVQSASTRSETVWLKDVTTKFEIDKRTPSDHNLPDQLTFHLWRGSDDLTLNLKRNYDINPNTDMYFVQKETDGQFRFVRTWNLKTENVAYYQDRENWAFMTVRCVKRSNATCERVINGNIRIGDNGYNLRPATGEFTSTNLLQVPDVHGKRYVLDDIENIRRENSVERKDAEKCEEKNLGQENITGHRCSHVPCVKLPSQNIADLVNRVATSDKIYSDRNSGEGRTRQLQKKYYVDVAVLIDSSVWNLYASMVTTKGKWKTRDKVKTKIRESFSHIMNGVNLLYKGIDDKSISITVTLSAFIFFPYEAFFPHNVSKVITVNGKTSIDVCSYHEDLTNWDIQPTTSVRPVFDHAMLFTRHTLLENSNPDVLIHGLTYEGEVCVPGGRTSIIQTDHYVRLVRTAAHELGHNLGASHDGENNAKDCNPEDLFIMTPIILLNNQDRPYSKNPWRFSNCSLELFKKTLKDKRCVKYEGKVYNEVEWNRYTKLEPGEVYSPNDQCHLINGPNSFYCGTNLKEICFLMRCTDPQTGTCLPDYFSAATGTSCGPNKWCIKERCVSKKLK